MGEELGLKSIKEKRATYLKGDLQEQNAKIRNNLKMQATQIKKTPRILPTSTVLAHPEKSGFSAQNASCGHMNDALMALPTIFA
jgi:hypothetical protein